MANCKTCIRLQTCNLNSKAGEVCNFELLEKNIIYIPCKPGDIIYYQPDKNNNSKILKATVSKIEINKYSDIIIFIHIKGIKKEIQITNFEQIILIKE